VTPLEGFSPSTLDEIFSKLILRLHHPEIHLPIRIFPGEDSSVLSFTEEGLLSNLSLSKPYSKVTFPFLQWLTLGKNTSTNP
jgi:hypothetical protein